MQPRPFLHVLPATRLGVSHPSLHSFYHAVYPTLKSKNNNIIVEEIKSSLTELPLPKKKKEYTLIIVTESCQERILLGMKNRGFGTGFYNSFGGKVDPTDSSVAFAAVRELKEEANICVPLHVMENSFVGKLDFTFEDNDKQMLVHLFHVDIKCVSKSDNNADNNISENTVLVDPDDIKPPEDGEITPEWFPCWYDIPLNKMFADDSIWLTKVLARSPSRQKLDGWFHFAPGGEEVNSILHHYIEYC